MIKIDVERSELDIIRGAEKIISSSNELVIIYDINIEFSGHEILDALNSLGFKSFTVKDGKLFFSIHKLDSVPSGTSNLVSVKQTKN